MIEINTDDFRSSQNEFEHAFNLPPFGNPRKNTQPQLAGRSVIVVQGPSENSKCAECCENFLRSVGCIVFVAGACMWGICKRDITCNPYITLAGTITTFVGLAICCCCHLTNPQLKPDVQ